jgi:hypothetical protein
MKRHASLVGLLTLCGLLLFSWATAAKLPSGYSHTRGLYIFFDNTTLTPAQVPVVGSFQRYNWSELEPGDGSYNWARIDDDVARWQGQGKLAAVGFSFFNEHEGTGDDLGIQIPSWLPGIASDVRWLNTRPNAGWYIPNYWSSSFRTYYRRFIREFARHIAQDSLGNGSALRDRVAWVSTGVGLSGETQPCKVWLDPYSRSQDYYYYNDVQGITSAQWLEYVNWCTDTYKQAFDQYGLSIPVFLDIGPTYKGERDQFSEYAANKGVGLRNNGLKVDRPDARTLYAPMFRYHDRVPVAWETYGTPNWLDSKGAVLWGLRCGLAKQPDNFTVDKTMVETEEYLPLLRFAADYCGVTVATTPGAWVALRQSEHHPGGGEEGNYNLWLMQKDDVQGGHAPAVWNVGQGRGYRFDLPNGQYQVELHFAEVYYNQAGARVFDIDIESQTVADNFDIWAAAGAKNAAVVRSYAVDVSDGRLDIDVRPETYDEPTLHAIKVSGTGYEKRINCGGRAFVDQSANTWLADREYDAGSAGYWGGGLYFSGASISGTDDDYLYQSMRLFGPGSLADGRYARRTDQDTENTRIYFDIDNSYMYHGSFSQAVITVTYGLSGSDRWRLRYDANGDSDKVAMPVGSANPWVQKDDSNLWAKAVFHLTDARFANGHPGSTDFSIDCMGDGDEFVSFVEVSKDVGVGPALAVLEGTVQLQGRPDPPTSQWSVPLTVTIGGTDVSVTTDQSGAFQVNDLQPGTYDISVKNQHTLRSAKSGVTLVEGTNQLAFGELQEGDANDDNCVNITDFSMLAAWFGQYDPRVDFNEDGLINISDFSLLAFNFQECGDVAVASSD